MNTAVAFAFVAVLAVANAGFLAAPAVVAAPATVHTRTYHLNPNPVVAYAHAAPVAYAHAAPVAYAHAAPVAYAAHAAPVAYAAPAHVIGKRSANPGLLAAAPVAYAAPAYAAPVAYAHAPAHVTYAAAPAPVAYAAPAVVKSVAPVAVSYNSGIIRGVPTVYAAAPVAKALYL